jgi:hypothetical protein
LQQDGQDVYLDRSAEEVQDELVADEELFIQRAYVKLCRTEALAYKLLRHEQGRVIPLCFEEVVTSALQDIAKPDSFLTKCPGLVLKEIRGYSVRDLLVLLLSIIVTAPRYRSQRSIRNCIMTMAVRGRSSELLRESYESG